MGNGWCRPVDSDSRVNGRVMAGLSSEYHCSSECSLLKDCVGYAFGYSDSRCYLYGPRLDQGLVEFVAGSSLSTSEWMGYSQTSTEIAGSSGHYGSVCQRKTGLALMCSIFLKFESKRREYVNDFQVYGCSSFQKVTLAVAVTRKML